MIFEPEESILFLPFSTKGQSKMKGTASRMTKQYKAPADTAPFFWKILRTAARFYGVLPIAGGVIYMTTSRGSYALCTVILAACSFSFCFYGCDKELAERGCRRIPEWNLLAWDLLGGWPGGLLGQSLFRHKTVKVSYRIKFLLCVFLNAGVTVWLIRESGHWFR